MTTTATPRRAVLVGVVAVFAAPTLATIAPDPIFAVIERHKVAYRISSVCGLTRCNAVDATWSPRYDEAALAAAVAEADDAEAEADGAAFALTTIRPTSMAGVFALIGYVEAFNSGGYALEDWGASSPMHWPECDDANEMDQFGYLILANVRAALEAMAVRS
jgi:hypothetical protein